MTPWCHVRILKRGGWLTSSWAAVCFGHQHPRSVPENLVNSDTPFFFSTNKTSAEGISENAPFPFPWFRRGDGESRKKLHGAPVLEVQRHGSTGQLRGVLGVIECLRNECAGSTRRRGRALGIGGGRRAEGVKSVLIARKEYQKVRCHFTGYWNSRNIVQLRKEVGVPFFF